jgi:hypothetical protein
VSLGELLENRRIPRWLQQSDENCPVLEKIELGLAARFIAAGTLHFEDHFGGGINLGRSIGEIAARSAVSFVGEAGPLTGAALDEDAVTGPRKLRNDIGYQGDATLASRDLARNSYEHVVRFRGVIGTR